MSQPAGTPVPSHSLRNTSTQATVSTSTHPLPSNAQSAANKENVAPLATRNEQASYIMQLQAENSEKGQALQKAEEKVVQLTAKGVDTPEKTSSKRAKNAKAVSFSHWAFFPETAAAYSTLVLPADYDSGTRLVTTSDTPEKRAREHLWSMGAVWEARTHLFTEPTITFQEWDDLKQATQSFGSFQNNLRTHASQILDGIAGPTPEDIAKIKQLEARTNNSRLLALLDHNIDPNDPYPTFCTLINSADPNPLKAIFRSPVIARVIILVLFGPSRILKPAPHPRTQRSYAASWDAKEVTAGMIAFSAMSVRWMVSSDDQFRPVGPRTGIDWMSEFVSYKRILLQNAEHEDIKSLYISLNRNVFGTDPIPAALPTPAAQPLQRPQNSFSRMEQAFAQASAGASVPNNGSSSENQQSEHADGNTGSEEVADTTAIVEEERPAMIEEHEAEVDPDAGGEEEFAFRELGSPSAEDQGEGAEVEAEAQENSADALGATMEVDAPQSSARPRRAAAKQVIVSEDEADSEPPRKKQKSAPSTRAPATQTDTTAQSQSTANGRGGGGTRGGGKKRGRGRGTRGRGN